MRCVLGVYAHVPTEKVNVDNCELQGEHVGAVAGRGEMQLGRGDAR